MRGREETGLNLEDRPAWFWPVVAVLALVVAASAVAFSEFRQADRDKRQIVFNHQQIAANKKAIDKSNRVLIDVCAALGKLDVLIVQSKALTVQARGSSGAPRTRYRQYIATLDAFHALLANPRGCKEVTG